MRVNSCLLCGFDIPGPIVEEQRSAWNASQFSHAGVINDAVGLGASVFARPYTDIKLVEPVELCAQHLEQVEGHVGEYRDLATGPFYVARQGEHFRIWARPEA